jgi:hypothetical protein
MTGFADVPFSQIKGSATSNQSLVDNFAKLESTTQTVEAAAFSIYDDLNLQHYDLTSSGNTLYYSGNLVLDQTTGAQLDDQSQIVGMAQLNLFDVTADAYAGLTVDNGELLLAGNPVGGDPITTGSTDNAILRADGTGGATLQNSAIVIDDEVVPFACTGVASTDVITAVGHNFTANQVVRFDSLTGGNNLNTSTPYFVCDISGDTFKVSTTSGGGAVNFTTDITAGTIVATQAHVAIANVSSATNSATVFRLKGTRGFIVGQKPDGTSTGGNARGSESVDIQVNRNSATQVASGQRSICIGGYSIASGTESIAIGIGLSSSGNKSIAIGRDTNSSGAMAVALGYFTDAYRNGMLSFQGPARFSAFGDSQLFFLVLREKTTTNSAVELYVSGPGDTGSRFTIPSGRVVTGIAQIIGSKSDGTAVATYLRQFSIKNVGGTTSLVGTVNTIGTDEAAGTSISITANDTNDALRIQATGITSETWRWTASVWATEEIYGA